MTNKKVDKTAEAIWRHMIAPDHHAETINNPDQCRDQSNRPR
jgi:hypothetical protein